MLPPAIVPRPVSPGSGPFPVRSDGEDALPPPVAPRRSFPALSYRLQRRSEPEPAGSRRTERRRRGPLGPTDSPCRHSPTERPRPRERAPEPPPRPRWRALLPPDSPARAPGRPTDQPDDQPERRHLIQDAVRGLRAMAAGHSCPPPGGHTTAGRPAPAGLTRLQPPWRDGAPSRRSPRERPRIGRTRSDLSRSPSPDRAGSSPARSHRLFPPHRRPLGPSPPRGQFAHTPAARAELGPRSRLSAAAAARRSCLGGRRR